MRHSHRTSAPSELTRRHLFRLAAAGVAATSTSGWIETLADATANDPKRQRACILLWMNGGPSQMDTFDLKPGHANGGPYKAIDTAVPGIQISEHLPKLAKLMKDIVLVRSMSTKEGDHTRATFNLRTGYLPQGQVQYPSLGSLVAKELAKPDLELPNFVSIAPFRILSPAAYGAGFLGHEYAPLIVGENGYGAAQQGANAYEAALKVKDLDLPEGINLKRSDARLDVLGGLNEEFVAAHSGSSPQGHRTAYERAVKLMRSASVKAFNLDEESKALRDAYGRNQFGQGCLLARRLVERGVPFVEVTLGGIEGGQVLGWDTHVQNFDFVKKLSGELDAGWSALMEDLRKRGLLDTTLIVWMGEFGRTPKINNNAGRDHFPNAWSTVLAGGGLKGGQVIGRTSADGTKVEDRAVTVPDFLATVCLALGIDPRTQNVSNVGRPIRIADPSAKAIKEALA
ncbi:MAG TPA: DUF1501 domain-containing protein [Isosphaeraceae bacterium]|jgi:hypothetical protein|nr:DUF1501 domain-containing protein [Isosphaeraceae bacterium]